MRTEQARLASAHVTTVRLNAPDPRSVESDALVIGIHSSPDGPRPAAGAEGIDDAIAGGLAATLGALGFGGAAGETAKFPSFGAVGAT